MADKSPFERVFSPDNEMQTPFGAMLGTVGEAMGYKTQKEQAQDTTGTAVQTMAQDVQNGASPQQAITNYFASPQGAQLFAQGASGDAILKFKALVDQTPTVSAVPPGQTPVINTPGKQPTFGSPTPTEAESTARTIPPAISVPPGNTVAQPVGGTFQPQFTAPTHEQQNFDTFTKLSAAPPEVVQKLASVWSLPPSQQPSEKARVIDQAVTDGFFTPAQAAYLKSDAFGPQGPIRIVSKLNRMGEVVGNTVIDLMNNKVTDVGMPAPPPAQGTPQQPQSLLGPAPGSLGAITAPQAVPGQARPAAPMATPAPAQPQPAQQQNSVQGAPTAAGITPGPGPSQQPPYSDKLPMFFGSGFFPQLSSAVGNVARQIDSRINIPGTEQISTNMRNLDALTYAIAHMAKEGAGLNIPSKYMDLVLRLAPGENIWSSDPKNALNLAIDTHGRITQGIMEDNAVLNDLQSSKQAKEKAETRINVYQGVLSALPPINQMLQLKQDYETNGPITQANEVSPSRFVGQVIQGLGMVNQKGIANTLTPQAPGAPAVPGATPDQPQSPFATMATQDLIKIDPSTLKPDQTMLYKQEIQRRLQDVRTRRGQQQ